MLPGTSIPMEVKLMRKTRKDAITGCWMWTGSVDKDGYGRMRGSIDKVVWSMRAPRASWECYVGLIPKGLMVLHHCDTPACINPQHLYLGTQAENGRDKKIRGRGRGNTPSGQSNPMSATNRALRAGL